MRALADRLIVLRDCRAVTARVPARGPRSRCASRPPSFALVRPCVRHGSGCVGRSRRYLTAGSSSVGHSRHMTVGPKMPLVRDQSELSVDDRLCRLLDDRSHACADALRAGGALDAHGIVGVSVAAALVGAPHPLTGRDDVLVDYADRPEVDDLTFELGSEPTARRAGPSFPSLRVSCLAYRVPPL